MEQGAISSQRRRVAAVRAVGFADDDSMPARDLATGEPLPPAPTDDSRDDQWGTPGLAIVGHGDGFTPAHPAGGDLVDVSPRRPRDPVDLADAALRSAPLTLARSRRLEVAPVMAPVLPEGLQRGSTVGVSGVGSLSLALATAAGPMDTGSWLAVVGCRDLCPVGAAALGVPLHRAVVVDEPPRGSYGSVLAALFDAFDVVIIDASTAEDVSRIAPRDGRRLAARARERGTVTIDVAGVWPTAPDTTIEVIAHQWSGLGDGHGVLTGRDLVVEVAGRRDGGRPRRVEVSLPAKLDHPVLAHAGSDIDALIAADLVQADADVAHRMAEGVERLRQPPLRRVG